MNDEETLRAARETIDRLSRDNGTLHRENTSLRLLRDELTRDRDLAQRQLRDARVHIEKIRQGIIDEAKERGWCDEVNDFLRGVGLNPWEMNFKVTFPETTITITASCAEQHDQEEVIRQAWEMICDDRETHMATPYVVES